MEPTLEITCKWRSIWYSRYLRGVEIVDSENAVRNVYRHRDSGQIRVYSRERGYPLDGRIVSVNGKESIPVEARGRWGRLHIEK